MAGEVERWADSAMYRSQERPGQGEGTAGIITPKVTLLQMTPDPLGSIAAACMMYEGRVARNLTTVDDNERAHYWQQVMKTKLQAPFEFVQLHFLLENVTRGFTHQLVRQRTAVYAQESLRFAVKQHIDEDVSMPPSIRAMKDDDPRRVLWTKAVHQADDAYTALVSSGVPAEDARGLLPHNIVTRVHYGTNLRALLDHAGNRLCTQAQFEWRQVFSAIAVAIRTYRPTLAEGAFFDGKPLTLVSHAYDWQYAAIAAALRPVCYQTGKCEFKADFDRSCSIRDRVDVNAAINRPSGEWEQEYLDSNRFDPKDIAPIRPEEWLLDPGAAR